MKRLISLFLCVALFSPLLLISASAAEPAITKSEAAELISRMYSFKETIGGSQYYTDIFLGSIRGTRVSDQSVYERLCEKLNCGYYPDMELFLLPNGEYSTLTFWHKHIKNFMTDDYVENKVVLRFGLIELGDKVYVTDPVLCNETPGFPHLCGCDLTLEDHITLVDNDTVLLEADYRNMDREGRFKEVDFEYTENGWRISGGEATEQFMYHASVRNTENPETSDGLTVIIACLAVSMLGVGMTISKRRRGYTV